MTDKSEEGNSASSFRFLAFNSNSIGRNPKRNQVFHFLKKKNADFIVVTDTRIAKEIENVVKAEWNGHAYFSSFDSQSRGVAIFMKKNLPVKILDNFSDVAGNILAILLEIEGKIILLEGIYGPNRDNPLFYSDEAFKKLSEWNPSHAIFVGDFNIALNPTIDTLNYQSNNNPRARLKLLEKIEEHGLIDIYRELNQTERKYSWKQWGSQKFGRLDYFLISNSLLPFVKKAEILPRCFSDHNPITLDIDFSRFTRGRGFWKMNNSLLYDTDYVDLIKKSISRITCQYAIIENDPNFFQNASFEDLDQFFNTQTPENLQILPLQINPELFLDTLMMELRRVTILYSAEKKRSRLAEEQILINDIEILEHHLQQNPVYVENIQTELNDKKDALENLYKYQAQGAYVRSRAKYKVEGEKPTRLFCSLEKYNGTQKYVPQIIIAGDNNTEVMVEDQKTIEKEIYKFYKDLFSCKDNFIEIDSIQTFLGPQGIENAPTLSEGDKVAMEGKITVEEMTKYIKKCKNNVAPGSTGFTYEFYKFFWRNLKTFVINSVDHSFEKNRLSVCQSLGIVSLIPKGEKDKRYLTNWRPITLLNSLYKLISGCIAERIKPVLDKIINPDQKGFVAGPYIGEAIRTTFDIMQYAKEYNIAGLILLIDFEKAYDSISFKYITKVLNFFNFGQDLIKWVEILLNNFTAVINHCGNISSAFNIGRGCRQGDPIASYLFILCIEILAIRLRSDSQIQSLKLGNISHLMEIYADDLTIYLEPNGENLRHVINILKDFYKLSGLKISVTKTKAVWIGSKHATNEKLCRDLNLQWVKKFTLLGVQFDNALENMKENFRLKLESIENMLSSWTYRYLTPFGKITVIKSLGLSKLSHVALVITNPSRDMIKKVEKVFFSFLWGKGSEKVRREDSKLPLLLGGLGMPDIMNFWTSFKFSWLRRLLTSNAFWPSLLLQEISNIRNSYTTSSDLLQLGVTKLNEISKHIKNPFWKQVLTSVSSVTEGSIFCSPGKLLDHSFWYNPTIKRARVIKHIDFPELQDKIATLADFFIPGTNSFLSHNQFCERYSVQLNLEKFIDIRFAINLALQKLNLPQTRLNVVQLPQRPIIIDIALSSRKGCSCYSKLL